MNYLKYLLSFILILSPFSLHAQVAVTTDLHVVISELQTASATSASHEFIEIYNPTGSPIAVDGWLIEYKSASSVDTATSWSKKATLSGAIESFGFYLIAPKVYLSAADTELSAGMAGSAGNVRLVSDDGFIIDQVGYGEAANAAEVDPAIAPGAGQTIERLPGLTAENAGNAIDTNNNASDFVVRGVPNPQSTSSGLEAPGSIDIEPPGEAPIETPIEPIIYPKVVVTEILVDPQAPLTDAEDEYIEIFNPLKVPALLTGYVLESGTAFNDSYELPETSIEAGGYLVLYSRDTKLSLVNSGGAVRILDPAGTIIDQTEVYPPAEPGLSWSLTDGSWDWTLQSTPGAENVYVPPLVTSLAKKEAIKKAALKKSNTIKKAAGKKVAAAKKPKTAKVKSATTSKPAAPMAKNFQPANWLIALLIGLTITYAVYEFRYDIQNLYRRARGNR